MKVIMNPYIQQTISEICKIQNYSEAMEIIHQRSLSFAAAFGGGDVYYYSCRSALIKKYYESHPENTFELLRKEFGISPEKLKKINISKTKATPIHQFHRPMDGDRQRIILNQRVNNQRFNEKGR